MSEPWKCPICGAERVSFGVQLLPISRVFDICVNGHKQLHYPKPSALGPPK